MTVFESLEMYAARALKECRELLEKKKNDVDLVNNIIAVLLSKKYELEEEIKCTVPRICEELLLNDLKYVFNKKIFYTVDIGWKIRSDYFGILYLINEYTQPAEFRGRPKSSGGGLISSLEAFENDYKLRQNLPSLLFLDVTYTYDVYFGYVKGSEAGLEDFEFTVFTHPTCVRVCVTCLRPHDPLLLDFLQCYVETSAQEHDPVRTKEIGNSSYEFIFQIYDHSYLVVSVKVYDRHVSDSPRICSFVDPTKRALLEPKESLPLHSLSDEHAFCSDIDVALGKETLGDPATEDSAYQIADCQDLYENDNFNLNSRGVLGATNGSEKPIKCKEKNKSFNPMRASNTKEDGFANMWKSLPSVCMDSPATENGSTVTEETSSRKISINGRTHSNVKKELESPVDNQLHRLLHLKGGNLHGFASDGITGEEKLNASLVDLGQEAHSNLNCFNSNPVTRVNFPLRAPENGFEATATDIDSHEPNIDKSHQNVEKETLYPIASWLESVLHLKETNFCNFDSDGTSGERMSNDSVVGVRQEQPASLTNGFDSNPVNLLDLPMRTVDDSLVDMAPDASARDLTAKKEQVESQLRSLLNLNERNVQNFTCDRTNSELKRYNLRNSIGQEGLLSLPNGFDSNLVMETGTQAFQSNRNGTTEIFQDSCSFTDQTDAVVPDFTKGWSVAGRQKISANLACKSHVAFNYPIGVAAISRATTVVADTANHQVCLLDKNMKLTKRFGFFGSGDQSSHFCRPSAVAVFDDGTFAVKDNFSIQTFSPEGIFLKCFGYTTLVKPYGLAVDSHQRLLTLDLRSSSTLHAFSKDGELLESVTYMPLKNNPVGSRCRFLAVGGDNLVVSDLGLNRMYVTDLQGRELFHFGQFGTQNGQFSEPSGVVVDSDGNFLIADSKNSRIQIFDSKGRFLSVLRLSYPIYRPSGMFLTEAGNLLVLNYIHHNLCDYKLL